MPCSPKIPPTCRDCAEQTARLVEAIVAAYARRLTPTQAAGAAEEVELICSQLSCSAALCPAPDCVLASSLRPPPPPPPRRE